MEAMIAKACAAAVNKYLLTGRAAFTERGR